MRLFFNISGANLTKNFRFTCYKNVKKAVLYRKYAIYQMFLSLFAQFSRFKERLIYRHLHRVSGMIKKQGGIDPITIDM